MNDVSFSQAWDELKSLLPSLCGQGAYNGWLKHLSFSGLHGAKVVLSVPSPFIRDWIQTRYGEQLLDLWKDKHPNILALDIVASDEDDSDDVVPLIEKIEPTTATKSIEPERTAGLDPRFTFENFIVGKSNELAYAAAQRVADAKSVYFNPLFLYGGVGLGKTHLMHAIAWHLSQNQAEKTFIYMSAETFMYKFIRSLRHKNIIAFREQFRSVDVLMIDDVQFIAGKDSTQEEFFHTFNALIDQKKQIILSSDKAPADLEGIEERMRSRLGWGLAADIHPTTYELRLGILQAKAEKLEIPFPKDVLEFLAHKITSNVRELEGALNRIVAHVTLVGGLITLDSIQDVLRDLLRSKEKYISVDDIQKTVAEHYNIRVADMYSHKRARVVARPRQVAMYLCKSLTSKSLPDIGKHFGGRDHTTVLHAVKKVEALITDDPAFREDVHMLQRLLRS